MTNDTSAQMVLAHIGSGRDNARSLSQIATEMGWSRRAVELAVRELRLQGRPICSDGSGVWYSLDPVDIAATLASLQHRAREQYKTFLALRRTYRAIRAGEMQQITLWRVLCFFCAKTLRLRLAA